MSASFSVQTEKEILDQERFRKWCDEPVLWQPEIKPRASRYKTIVPIIATIAVGIFGYLCRET